MCWGTPLTARGPPLQARQQGRPSKAALGPQSPSSLEGLQLVSPSAASILSSDCTHTPGRAQLSAGWGRAGLS